MLWWVTRYRDGIVVTTAPTWTQVERVLWGEIKKVAALSRIGFPPLNQTELKLGPNNYAIGLSTNEGVRFQGFHGRILIIILDEAPGVKPEIWEAIEGIRAGGDVRVLALGNPTLTSGPFYDAFTTNRDAWKTFTISAFDTPNLAGLTLESLLALDDGDLDRNPRPYLVTRRWVREKWHEWGAGHPLWEARVLGQFPTQAEDALISLRWIEEAAARPIGGTGGRLTAGLDVAGPGEDETVLVITDGPSILALQTWTKSDPRGEVVAALATYKGKLACVNIDSAGIGHYMARHLEDLGYPVRDVNVGETADDQEKYANLKAELYWGLRMRFQAGHVAGLRDERTIGRLAGIRYSHDTRGRVKIESKEDARKRGVKSPDRAEAVMLAFAKRPLGWTMVDLNPVEARPAPAAKVKSPYLQQVQNLMPALFPDRDPAEVCGNCVEFATRKDGKGKCRLRLLQVDPPDLGCEHFDLAERGDDDEEYGD